MALSLYTGKIVTDKLNPFWNMDVRPNLAENKETQRDRLIYCLNEIIKNKPKTIDNGEELFISCDSGIWLSIQSNGKLEFGEGAA